jgi:hypothetical protein
MKKIFLPTLSLLLIFTFTGCSNKTTAYTSSKAEQNAKVLKLYKTQLLPRKYILEQAQKNGDVIRDLNGNLYNSDKFLKFIENIENKKKDNVRLTSYTIEGGSIIKDLVYDGKNIFLISDTTRDDFSGFRDIKKYTVSNIQKDKDCYVAIIDEERFDLITIK